MCWNSHPRCKGNPLRKRADGWNIREGKMFVCEREVGPGRDAEQRFCLPRSLVGKIVREEDCREQVGGAPSKHIPTLPSLPAAAYITQDDISLAKIKFTPFSRNIYHVQGPYFLRRLCWMSLDYTFWTRASFSSYFYHCQGVRWSRNWSGLT